MLCGYSYATGCKASGTLKVGEFTFGETSYIISSSAGKGTSSACASSSDRGCSNKKPEYLRYQEEGMDEAFCVVSDVAGER
jgi:hypothetical protein